MSIQDYNTRLENNNTNLNEILNTINNLPTLKLQDKSVTPTKEKQTIKADETYNGLGSVSVEAIPSRYVEPSGTLEITKNGEYEVKNYESVTTNVHEPTPYAPKYISFYYYRGTDLSQETATLDTSNVTSMYYMFGSCSSLTTLDINHFDTSNVTDMQYMFISCTKLTSLDLNNWDTSKVTTFYSTFGTCTSLASINVKDWNVSNAGSFYRTFIGCGKLTELDLSGWVTTKATNMQEMFQNCWGLTKLDIRNFDFTKVTSYRNMFGLSNDCLIIVKDDTAKSWITSKFTNLTNVKTVAEL